AGLASVALQRPMGSSMRKRTGRYDVGTVAELRKARGHTEFGVYATVIEGGELAVGDALTV
ncbi:MAG: hypothetical protein AAFP23_02130, partial [Pseudomonadota bacterium]